LFVPPVYKFITFPRLRIPPSSSGGTFTSENLLAWVCCKEYNFLIFIGSKITPYVDFVPVRDPVPQP
jgi:hypothetical protein